MACQPLTESSAGHRGLANQRWVKVDSPFGAPSDELLMGELDGQPLAFLPRHG